MSLARKVWRTIKRRKELGEMSLAKKFGEQSCWRTCFSGENICLTTKFLPLPRQAVYAHTHTHSTRFIHACCRPCMGPSIRQPWRLRRASLFPNLAFAAVCAQPQLLVEMPSDSLLFLPGSQEMLFVLCILVFKSDGSLHVASVTLVGSPTNCVLP